MQPEKIIEPPKELEEDKPELIDIAKQTLPIESTSPTTVYSPDQLDKMQHEANAHANELIANAELKEIDEKGIVADSDNPYFHPSTNRWSLTGWVWGEKVVGAPSHRARRFIFGVIFIVLLIGFLVLKQHTANEEQKKFTQQFPKLNYSNNQ